MPKHRNCDAFVHILILSDFMQSSPALCVFICMSMPPSPTRMEDDPAIIAIHRDGSVADAAVDRFSAPPEVTRQPAFMNASKNSGDHPGSEPSDGTKQSDQHTCQQQFQGAFQFPPQFTPARSYDEHVASMVQSVMIAHNDPMPTDSHLAWMHRMYSKVLLRTLELDRREAELGRREFLMAQMTNAMHLQSADAAFGGATKKSSRSRAAHRHRAKQGQQGAASGSSES